MSENPRTWPMLAALPIDANPIETPILATMPCLNGPLVGAAGLGHTPARWLAP